MPISKALHCVSPPQLQQVEAAAKEYTAQRKHAELVCSAKKNKKNKKLKQVNKGKTKFTISHCAVEHFQFMQIAATDLNIPGRDALRWHEFTFWRKAILLQLLIQTNLQAYFTAQTAHWLFPRRINTTHTHTHTRSDVHRFDVHVGFNTHTHTHTPSTQVKINTNTPTLITRSSYIKERKALRRGRSRRTC